MAKQDNLNRGNPKHAFTKENQPSPEAISRGMKKASLLRKIAKQIVKGGVKDALIPLAEYLGLNIDEIDLETTMHLKQIEKAIKEGDTQAYNSVMNRILGKVKENIVLEGGENPLKFQQITGMEIK